MTIESYLGKDRLPNLHWNPEIPPMWAIPARTDTGESHTEAMKSRTILNKFNQVPYTYNNLGYRSYFDYTDELKSKKVILVLGCSDAFGQLIEHDKMYSSVMQQLMPDYTIVNLAIPGASPDSATRIGVQTILHLKGAVKYATMLWPVMSLREFVSKNYCSGVHTLNNNNVPYDDWWDHIDWVSNNYNYMKNKILLDSVCKAHDIKFADLIVNRNDPKVPYDLLEFGPYTALGEKTHSAIANYFVTQFA